MDAKDKVLPNETILYEAKANLKQCIKSRLSAWLLMIVMWVIMDAFFVYLILLKSISINYWFVAIPVIGFNVLAMLMFFVDVSREQNRVADITYILTDKAVYYINNGGFKQNIRFSIQDIVKFEKDKNSVHTFFVCVKDNFFKVEYISDGGFYAQMAKLVNSR